MVNPGDACTSGSGERDARPGDTFFRMPRTRLVWKWEEGYEEGETPVGPAWIVTLDEDGKVTLDEDGKRKSIDVAGGEWITRAEAIRLARESGHNLLLDE
jgi:hypothetical protein